MKRDKSFHNKLVLWLISSPSSGWMRFIVLSFQDSFQDRTLKEDKFNLLVEKHGESWKPREETSWQPNVISRGPFAEGFENMILTVRSWTFMEEFHQSVSARAWKSCSWGVLGTIWIRLTWSHCTCPSPRHPPIYHRVAHAVWTVWTFCETFKALEYRCWRVATKHEVVHGCVS